MKQPTSYNKAARNRMLYNARKSVGSVQIRQISGIRTMNTFYRKFLFVKPFLSDADYDANVRKYASDFWAESLYEIGKPAGIVPGIIEGLWDTLVAVKDVIVLAGKIFWAQAKNTWRHIKDPAKAFGEDIEWLKNAASMAKEAGAAVVRNPGIIIEIFRSLGSLVYGMISERLTAWSKKKPFSQGFSIGELAGRIIFEIATWFIGIGEISAALKGGGVVTKLVNVLKKLKLGRVGKLIDKITDMASEMKVVKEAEELAKTKGIKKVADEVKTVTKIKKVFRIESVTFDEFAVNPKIQKEVFNIAKKWRNEQRKFMKKFLKKNGIKAKSDSILKRDNPKEFVDSVIAKGKDRGYKRLSQMDDIVRGRINTKSAKDADKIYIELLDQNQYKVKSKESPRRGTKGKLLAEEEFGYPRYHVILEDLETGLTHEWQIGTKSVTKVFEQKGIEFPDPKLEDYFNPDLHDIEYDLFSKIIEDDYELSKKFNMPDFCKKVDKIAGKAGKYGDDIPEEKLLKEINALHKEASIILKDLYDKFGIEFIIKYSH